MTNQTEHDAWSAGQSYEHYMGRWSRQIAIQFLDWLGAPDGKDWVDIGCGTGALTQTILDRCQPTSIVAIDPSDGFIAHAGQTISDDRVTFEVAGAEDLPLADGSIEVATSALALNFVPNRIKALHEIQRVLKPGGIFSFYVWDYPGGGMGFIDAFWSAAAELDPAARELDESARFPYCNRQGLFDLCEEAGVNGVDVEAVEIQTTFPTFADFLHPFTLGAGPAPGYYVSLDETQKGRLRAILARTVGQSEPVALKARAWAVKKVLA